MASARTSRGATAPRCPRARRSPGWSRSSTRRSTSSSTACAANGRTRSSRRPLAAGAGRCNARAPAETDGLTMTTTTASTTPISGAQLYRRGAETMLGSWVAIARGACDAAVLRLPGVAAAVFPVEPERSIYNNALLERDLAPAERAAALDAMEAAYAAAGVTRFAAWTHESDHGMRADLEARGYGIDTTTRAMGMDLAEDLRLPRAELALERAGWPAYLRYLE